MRLVTVAGEPEREAALAAELDARRDVDVVLRCVDRVEVLAAIRGAGIDACVVIGDPVWFDAECAHEAAQSSVTLVAVAADPLAAERFRSMGAAVLTDSASVDEILRTCAEVSSPQFPTEPASPREPAGRLTAVWGPKGAPGRSSIAIELATELAAAEPATLLVDADTYGGDLLQLLGVTEDLPTIVWATRLAAKRELTADRLGQELRRVGEGGPVLLPGIPRAELWPEVSDFGWRELLGIATEAFRHVVCDVGFSLEPNTSPYPEAGEGRNRAARVALRSADRVIACVRADPVGIKNFVWAFEQLLEVVELERVSVVANRVRPGEEDEVADIVRRYVHARPIAFVPDTPAAFVQAAAEGRPIRELRGSSGVTTAVAEIAAVVGGRVAPRGLFARLGGRT